MAEFLIVVSSTDEIALKIVSRAYSMQTAKKMAMRYKQAHLREGYETIDIYKRCSLES